MDGAGGGGSQFRDLVPDRELFLFQLSDAGGIRRWMKSAFMYLALQGLVTAFQLSEVVLHRHPDNSLRR